MGINNNTYSLAKPLDDDEFFQDISNLMTSLHDL